ncbi:hypothetical protein ACT6NV_12785 [Robiginitalea sp. IMCC44478]|uniref:hypothetical protein n=1 Tax=Robiginitalea sp. IMCC44478 TaxID=3459122 RepID=UPI004041B816
MKKLLSLAFSAALVLVSCETEQLNDQTLEAVNGKATSESLDFVMEGCSGSVRNLIAGQNTVVGTVSVEEDGSNYVITYSITEGDYCLTEAHVDVADDPSNFAINQTGNPKIGNFDYVNDGIECTNSFSVTVANEGPWLAIHGVVECSTNSLETITANLPETVDFCAINQGPDAYVNISLEGGILTGDYGSWCIDNDLGITPNCFTDVPIYESSDANALPEGLLEKPENLDLVNWLLNQNIVGTESPNALGTYTYGDLQFAIWYLIDVVEDPTGANYSLGAFLQGRVDELIALATASGEGFNPECGDFIGIILVPGNNVQPLIIPYPTSCNDCDETIWAEGCGFPGGSWAMYFEYAE